MTAIPTVTDVDEASSRRRARLTPARQAVALVALVVLAWLVPVGAHAVGLDAVLPILVLALTVALQRGRLVERLVVAVVQLFGALCAAGLLLTVWPWGLDPVPVAGATLTALVVLGAATGRLRPIPARALAVRANDRLLVLAALGVAAVAAVPYVARDLGGRLGIPLAGEDIARHFLIYDVIGRTEGYLFLDPDVLRPYASDFEVNGIANYPQGLHFTYAVLERFVHPGGASAVASADVLMWLLVATYALFGAAVLWSVRRIAGPGATVARLTPVLAVAGAWLCLADPVTVLSRGYPNELAGLACCAVVTALVARPMPDRGGQVATMAAALVGTTFSYPLFLPYAGVVALFWAWRARLWRVPWAWAYAVAAVPLAAVGPVTAITASSGDQLVLAGTARVVDRPATLLLVALAAVAVLARSGLRSPARRAAGFAVATMVVFVAGVGAYQIATVGRPVYYFDKLLHLLIVVALGALGGLVRLAPGGGRLVSARGLALAAPVVLALAAAGGTWHATPVAPGLALAIGRDFGSPDGARDALLITRRYPDGDGAVSVSLMGGPWRNWYATQLASVLQRQYRGREPWYSVLAPHGRPTTFADLDRMVAASPMPVRFFVADPTASMLVLDPDHPNRPGVMAGRPYPVAFGDPAAPSNVEAVRELAGKYPGKVLVVTVTP